MTISAHQVDSVLKAYTKQIKTRYRPEVYETPGRDRYADVVTLSVNDQEKADVFSKISYSLLDVIRKDTSSK
ncbi:MAG TPA: hypothetical protein PK175_00640 [Syntrophales bacterium]|jgi:hypothetical protein|nr:hypothetical protein [Syntrophales bacterium]HON23300.1 hypothetical protein [Syntrophales bacterium]HOU76700.1 hypothetical protein [Syntrophales bacterium]HPC31457.1 hypothetical protein [Syntrophales bacterium]HQG33364.1 hypothetical protein [Syntrophales bacterium]